MSNQKVTLLKVGMRIHVKSKKGMYTVLKVTGDGVHVSSRIAIARANHPELIPTQFYKYSDIKCLAGGMNNHEFYPLEYFTPKASLNTNQ